MADILLLTSVMPQTAEALASAHTLHTLPASGNVTDLPPDIAGRITAAATFGIADRSQMDGLPNLEIISSFGVGYDGVDATHAARSGIVVTNTPGVLDDDVANMAVLLLLACSRRLCEWDRYARAGTWETSGHPPLTRAINGRKVGILGLGRIGQDIARKLQAFGCEIIYHGRRKQDDQPHAYYGDLVAMARDADFLIAICPGGEATRGIVNAPVLEALGPHGTFINVSRGSVHDEAALIEALQSGKLGYAGLDVFEDEPHIPDSLRTLDNVILQPHQGSATVETRERMAALMADNLLDWLEGKPARTPVAECAHLNRK